jgi:hypothetical protein
VFDIGSNFMLWWLHRKALALDLNKWPVGGARLETIGNVIYGKTLLHPVVSNCIDRTCRFFASVLKSLRQQAAH